MNPLPFALAFALMFTDHQLSGQIKEIGKQVLRNLPGKECFFRSWPAGKEDQVGLLRRRELSSSLGCKGKGEFPEFRVGSRYPPRFELFLVP